jgi:tRNA G18 (ribose-2'-O)-methylase SpoU
LIETIDRKDDPRLEAYRHVGDPQWLLGRGLFVAEGRIVVERLLRQRTCPLTSVLVTRAALEALAPAFPGDLTVFVAEPSIVHDITGFNFHRGCLALAARPQKSALSAFADAGLLVVLEGVSNPDNVGGIFRSAAALGAEGVVLDPSCGDPLYRKAIRTSMGAVLSLPFATIEPWPEGISALRRMGFTTVALAPAGAVTVYDLAATLASGTRVALMAGAEGSGLTAPALAEADVAVRIPIDPRRDSLNVVVAVSIALHCIGRI